MTLEKKLRIIIIDDNEAFVDCTKSHLEDKGYKVRGFSEIYLAGKFLNKSEDFDVALVDRSLGSYNVDGDEVMRYIKETFENKKIICISGYYDKPEHADYFLTKPFGKEGLHNLDSILEELKKDF